MENKHLPFGGSTAGRTLACPAWVSLSAQYPKPASSKYADEGNLLHDCMEERYMTDKPFLDMLTEGRAYGSMALQEEHLDMLYTAHLATEDALREYDIAEYACEAFVQYKPDIIGGSIDMLGRSGDGKTCMVLDYKFGHNGVAVKQNPSLMFYAVCVAKDPKYSDFIKDAEQIVYVIIQPQKSSAPLVWESNRVELQQFESDYLKAYYIASGKNPPTQAGNHCKYCPAAAYCDTTKQQVLSSQLISPTDAGTIAEALAMIPQLKEWISTVETTAHSLLTSGAVIKGYKLVEKRAMRKWIDAKKAEAELFAEFQEKIYEKSLLSPAKMDKLASKSGLDISHLIKKESSGTTLAPESSDKPAVNTLIADSLQNLVNAK